MALLKLVNASVAFGLPVGVRRLVTLPKARSTAKLKITTIYLVSLNKLSLICPISKLSGCYRKIARCSVGHVAE
jgi:hypothetical protein